MKPEPRTNERAGTARPSSQTPMLYANRKHPRCNVPSSEVPGHLERIEAHTQRVACEQAAIAESAPSLLTPEELDEIRRAALVQRQKAARRRKDGSA